MANEYARDMIAALNSLQGNVQRLQFQRTISQANEAVQQIRTSEANEAEQMQALRGVAEQVTFNLAATGASPQQIQQLTQTINPNQEYERAEKMAAAQARGTMGVKMQAQQAMQGQQAMILEAAMQGNPRAIQMLPKETRERFVPGVGVASTKEGATDIRKLTTELTPAMDQIERLKQINQISGRSFSPRLRAEAAQIQRTLIGSLRVALTGPGAMNESEQKLLEEAVANPTDLFSVGSLTEQKLTTLQNALSNKLTSAYQAVGIAPPDAAGMPSTSIPGLRPLQGRKGR